MDGQCVKGVGGEGKGVDRECCSFHVVGCNPPAGVAWKRGVDHAQVVLLAGGNGGGAGGECFDPTRRRAGPKSSGVGHGHCTGPTSAVVRSKPNAMLKHSTPCPEAPFIRLSRAAVTTAFLPCADTLTRQRFE